MYVSQYIEFIVMSAVVTKINHVGKRQDRTLAISNTHIYNISAPTSFIPNRIKRKIPLSSIIGISASTESHEMVIHIDK